MSGSENVKQSYISYGAKVQWVTRKNQLAQKSDVVNFKATLFFYNLTMLTNASPGVQWIRDMGT